MSAGTSVVDLHKQLSAAEEEEDFSWDIEDEDDVRPVYSVNFINQVTTVANASCALQDFGLCISKIVPNKGHKLLIFDHPHGNGLASSQPSLITSEEARASLVKRAISGDEEEDLSWDFDGDDNEEEGSGFLSKGESNKESVIKEIEREDGDVPSLQSPFKSMDTLGEKGGSCKDSDVSIVSSQSLQEEDLGWDEIEDIGSNDESKVEAVEKHKWCK
uniref:Uncharacterized protein n=1 Tax=Salix viminalis TaxID=40686 RepID=A0A6N2NMA3_SALVM